MDPIIQLLPLFRRIKLALKQRGGISLVIDHTAVACGTICVTGWAISTTGPAGIRQIDVHVNTAFAGTASYGDARPDLKRMYPFVSRIGACGFHLCADLPANIASDAHAYDIRVTAFGMDGRCHTQYRRLPNPYQHWIAACEPDAHEFERQRQSTFPYTPTISILTALSPVSPVFLTAMLDSVMRQTSPDWEYCLVGDSVLAPSLRDLLMTYAQRDSRIKLKLIPSPQSRSQALNEALTLATGDFIGILEPGDMLAPFALFAIIKCLNTRRETDYLYSDEDCLSDDGQTRYAPAFKPDWSPDFLRSTNYPAHFSVVRRSLLAQIGGFREEFVHNLLYDMILRVSERTRMIVHIPQVLYHHRMPDRHSAVSESVKTSHDTGQQALKAHLDRQNIDGSVESLAVPGYYHVTYQRKQSPIISIIIPNRDHAADLQRCVDSLLQQSRYRQFEILIVENGSRDQETFRLYEHLREHTEIALLIWDQGFNYSAINNFAARAARGDVLLFLNNDTEVRSADWLERMLEHALRADVGAVGAKLCYPDGTIQHAGLIVGVHEIVGHAHKFLPGRSNGYLGRLNSIHNVSAITAACLMMRKTVFDEVGGFDERFQVDFNDIDLCLRLRERGYLIVWTPYAELYHFESKTRSFDNQSEQYPAFTREKMLFRQRWQQALETGDPYYNQNLAVMEGLAPLKKAHAKAI